MTESKQERIERFHRQQDAERERRRLEKQAYIETPVSEEENADLRRRMFEIRRLLDSESTSPSAMVINTSTWDALRVQAGLDPIYPDDLAP